MSSTKSSTAKFESIDSIVNYLREPSPPEVVSSSTPSTVISSTKPNGGLKSTKKLKKEKEQIQINAEGAIEVLSSGRVRYGPVTVNPRKQPSKTLFTGRRSKYELLTGDEEEKRRVRRDRNRVAATKCREKRENVLSDLEMEHHRETKHHAQLVKIVKELEEQRQKLQSILNHHFINCTTQPINSMLPPPPPPPQQQQQQISMVFGDPTFLTMITETPAPPLPTYQSQTISHDEGNFNNFPQAAPVLTNSIYNPDQSNYFFPPEQYSQQEPINMYSSSIERLMNIIQTPTPYIDNNNNTCSGLINSAYGTSTCAQQHSSSSEDDSLPSTHKNPFVY